MTDPIIAYSGVMRAQIERLNSIAHNASNVNSTGFLQEKTAIDGMQFQSILHGGNPQEGYSISHHDKIGSLRITNLPTNLAVTTNSWFKLQTQEGDSAITRNGNFTLTESGSLMLGTAKVMGQSGPIDNVDKNFSVHADGSIYVGTKYIDKLMLIAVPDKAVLTATGNGVYTTDAPYIDSDEVKVVQGALTSSNVDMQTDMTKMVEITRHVEMLQRAMSAYNDLLETGINKIGK